MLHESLLDGAIGLASMQWLQSYSRPSLTRADVAFWSWTKPSGCLELVFLLQLLGEPVQR